MEVQELFVKVDLADPENLGVGTITLTATIQDWQFKQISEYGFVWTSKNENPSLVINEGSKAKKIRNKEDGVVFKDTVVGLNPSRNYTFVAYIIIDETPIYSQPKTIKTATAIVVTDPWSYLGGFEIQVNGHLERMEQGLIAVEHGFCWSKDNPLPTLQDNSINLGIRRDTNDFSATVTQLIDNTEYHMRAYAVISSEFRLDTIYGQTRFFAGDLNFWTSGADYLGKNTNLFKPVFLEIKDKIYVINYDNNMDVWRFDPSIGEKGKWESYGKFPDVNFYKAPGFSIGDKGYFGPYFTPTGAIMFWEYDPDKPENQRWIPKATPTGARKFEDGVGFSIGNKGYVGLGVRNNEIWEYDPTDPSLGSDANGNPLGKWLRKANYPGRERTHPVHFVAEVNGDTLGYVLMGRGGDTETWEFNPKAGLDGKWTAKANFPGGARSKGHGFGLNGKGYYGLGLTISLQLDFWEYDPNDSSNGLDENGRPIGKWTRRANFIGRPRIDSHGFSVKNKGYIGFGLDTPTALLDFWIFNP